MPAQQRHRCGVQTDPQGVSGQIEKGEVTVGEEVLDAIAVIISDVGSVSDYVVQGKNGLLVQAGDVVGIVNSIDVLYKDELLRRRIAEAELNIVLSHTWKQKIKKLSQIIHGIAKHN